MLFLAVLFSFPAILQSLLLPKQTNGLYTITWIVQQEYKLFSLSLFKLSPPRIVLLSYHGSRSSCWHPPDPIKSAWSLINTTHHSLARQSAPNNKTTKSSSGNKNNTIAMKSRCLPLSPCISFFGHQIKLNQQHPPLLSLSHKCNNQGNPKYAIKTGQICASKIL